MADVAVFKCKKYDSYVDKAVSKALDSINAKALLKKDAKDRRGSKGKQNKKEMKVLIKPNILGSFPASEAITTHPKVIDAICKYLKPYKVRLFFGESSGAGAVGGTTRAFKISGIEKIAKKYGAEIIDFDKDERIVKKNNANKVMKSIVISKKLGEMDLVINACKLKTHMLTGYTGAVKNMYGILPGRAKVSAHQKGKDLKVFSNILLDVYSVRKPDISVMDAVVGMEGNGPSNGKPIETGLIIASSDGLALDAVASNIIGFKTDELEFLKLAKSRKLIPANIKILGLENITVPYKKPSSYRFGHTSKLFSFFMQKMQAFFEVNKKECIKCKHCERVCPVGAITFKNGYPSWDKNKCIMCYCCHELCPKKAIYLKKPFIARLADKFTRRYDD